MLTEAGIASNCVAGYYHDHLFIKVGDEQRVMSWVFECENVFGLWGDKNDITWRKTHSKEF